jgi:hypothetical protein
MTTVVIPSYGEISHFARKLFPICISVPQGLCVGANTAVVICKLRIVFDDAGVEFNNIGILY